MHVFRFLFGLLVGVIIGVGGTGYFFSTAGGGDYLLASSRRVQKLEQDLQRVGQERDLVSQKLEDATKRIQDMANRFDELEHRFNALETLGVTKKSNAETAKETSNVPPPPPNRPEIQQPQ